MPGRRRIYVDIDDVLSQTIESLIELLAETHGRRVDVEEVLFFDLERSFGLSPREIHAFMDRVHEDDVIESIPPVEGGAETLSSWRSAGHDVHLVTGRPPSTNAASRRWLARHAVPHTSLHHLDKWGRPTWNDDGLPALRFDDLHEMGFEFAVEDSLETAVRLVEDFDLTVALMDRPWNRDLAGVSAPTRARLTRCLDWTEVAALAGRLR